ncbi:hypothetical protein ABZ896_11695 [Streptomyces sp. NPDC047072]|uniref:DUF7715 family protein n=1 Tax=Streptomyces sp. NPDC047072 TaxID=3154809 RepID=UPI0033E7A41F
MKLLITAAESNYYASPADYSWTLPGEVLTTGTPDTFVGLGFGRSTTRARVTDVDIPRAEVLRKIIGHLTRSGLYELDGQVQSVRTRQRITAFLGLADGFDVGTVLELHDGTLRPVTGSGPAAAS